MKNYLIFLLQKIIGYERYLYLFAKIKIRLLRFTKIKKTYLHFEQLLPTEANVVVVGASIGITTIPLLKSQRAVFAYEPIPSNVAVLHRLKQKYQANKLSIYQLALGNRSGNTEIVFPTLRGAKKHGLSYIKEIELEVQPKGEVITVEIDRIDARPELNARKIDAMKVVAENYELEIFKGSQQLIARDAPIIYCELWDNQQRNNVLELIRSMNYTVLILVNGKLEQFDNYAHRYQGKHFIFRPR